MINNQEVLILKDRYKIDLKKEIGKGSYGIVYECQDLKNENPDQTICAKITCIKANDKSKREFELMSKLKNVAKENPNIVGVIDVLVHDQQIILIQEKCEGDLFKLIVQKRKDQKRFTPAEALNIIKQICNGYKVLLAHNIIHRDLKPENILYVKNTYKIADFGFARIADQNGIHTKLGTPRYCSPQNFWDYKYTYSTDIYSLGIIFYQLIFDEFPFTANTPKELENKLFLLKENPIKVSRDLPEVDDSIPTLIEQMLLYSEEDRIDWGNLFKHKLLINQFEFKTLSLKDNENEKASVNPPTTQILITQNQIIPNTHPMIRKQISTPVQGTQVPMAIKAPTISQFSQFYLQNLSSQHYQIGIFFAYIEQEVFKYMNTQQQYLNKLLFLRNLLCNLALIFIDSAKNGQQNFTDQQQQEIKKLEQIERNIEVEFNDHDFRYCKQQLELQKQVFYIQEIKKLINTDQMKYQNNKTYFFPYLRVIYALLLITQANNTNLYDLVQQIVKNYNNQNLVIDYLNQTYK